MTLLRRVVWLCVLIALPLQLTAAWATCCPAPAPTRVAGHDMHHAHQALPPGDSPLAHAGHPCDETDVDSTLDTHDGEPCKNGQCASHCAHAQPPLVTIRTTPSLALADSAPAGTGTSARCDAPSSPALRPPIDPLR